MSFSSDVLTLNLDGSIATLWLDRPDQRNAMGPNFWTDLPRAMQAIDEADDVRAVILAARGPAFTAGLDLKAMGPMLFQQDEDASDVLRRQRLHAQIRQMQAAITSVADCAVPVIVAVHGYCLGGGIDLITACDVRLAAADAVFSVRETKMAIVADLGTLQRLPRIIPQGHVAELVYTGKDIDAERGRAIGLVNDVFPDASAVQQAARAMADEIANNSPLVVQGAKHVLRAGEDQTVEEGLDYVALWNTSFLLSNDLSEAVMAFMQQRDPEFSGT
jgi:enoyl-CoA hydratase